MLPRHASQLPAGRPPAERLALPEPLLDVWAQQHGARMLLAELGMVAAEGDELLADGAPSAGLPLAALGVLHDPFQLLAGGQGAARARALAGMGQPLDAAQDVQPVRISRARGGRSLPLAAFIVAAET